MYQKGEKIPPEGYFSMGILSTLSFLILQMAVYFVKIVVISNDTIRLIFPLRFKKFEYPLLEIKEYKIYQNYGHWKNYESLHFRTADGRIYDISQYEYWNYKRLRNLFEKKFTTGEVSKLHKLKVVLIMFLAAVVSTVILILGFNTIT
jgi:hypothetical protein